MSKAHNPQSTATSGPISLRDGLRKARIEAADRTGIVVDLRDAEVARLEMLNKGLDHLFAQVPEQDRFVRSRHQPGRDAQAGGPRRDVFVQDTRFDRIVLAESHEARAIVVTECRAPHGRARTCVRRSAGAGPGQDGEAQAQRFLFVTLGFVLFALALFLALRGF